MDGVAAIQNCSLRQFQRLLEGRSAWTYTFVGACVLAPTVERAQP